MNKTPILGIGNKTINGCCKECEERYPGCHGKCEKYKVAKEEWEAFKKSKKFSVYDDYKFKAVAKEKIRRSKK